jgi:hypothetical protein
LSAACFRPAEFHEHTAATASTADGPPVSLIPGKVGINGPLDGSGVHWDAAA